MAYFITHKWEGNVCKKCFAAKGILLTLDEWNSINAQAFWHMRTRCCYLEQTVFDDEEHRIFKKSCLNCSGTWLLFLIMKDLLPLSLVIHNIKWSGTDLQIEKPSNLPHLTFIRVLNQLLSLVIQKNLVTASLSQYHCKTFYTFVVWEFKANIGIFLLCLMVAFIC